MSIETLIKQLKFGDPPFQSRAAALLQLENGAYPVLPLLVKKAREIDVNNGPIDIHSSNFVGEAAKTAAKQIRKIGYSENDEFHRHVKDWILELNYCSEINAAAHSVTALGDLWTPPESVRTRLIELVHIQRRPDNLLDHPGTVRGLAYRELSSRDRETAQRLIDTPARREFQEFINYLLDIYRIEYPNNKNMPQRLWTEIAWLEETAAG